MTNKLSSGFDSFIAKKYPNFKFRPGQKEAIIDIIDYYERNPNGVYLLDAPTGSGKSIIAIMFSDYIASKQHSGYILTSELSLHEQYQQDFNRLNLSAWGNITGVDNYSCHLNNQPFSVGECKNKGLSYRDAAKLNCYSSCQYFQTRNRAIDSKVTLLTYSFALIQRNYVEDRSINGSPFKKRDFVICDEAHKLLDIVQSHFSPKISPSIRETLIKLQAGLSSIGFQDALINIDRATELINYIIDEEDKTSLLSALKSIMAVLGKALHYRDDVSKRAKDLFGEHNVAKEWQDVFKRFDRCKDIHCKIEDYIEIIEKNGLDYMIKNPTKDSEVTFNCMSEHYLMDKHMFSRFGFKLLMTATMGDKNEYAKSLGIKKFGYTKMQSLFDYSESPIHFYPNRRMSKKDIDKNFDWLVKEVEKILNANKLTSGIIHSGSYELANRLYKASSREVKKRLVLYNGTDEKIDRLSRFDNSINSVLVGPSLLDGINLNDDKSRLQIFLKVPYPNLGDKYVSAKMKYDSSWYHWKTTTSILQGVGRSIRNENDWAITYFLDGCLTDLLMKSDGSFPDEFVQRINIIQ